MRRPREDRLYLHALFQLKCKLANKYTIYALHRHGYTTDDVFSLFNELIVVAIRKYNGGLGKWYTFTKRIIRNVFSLLVGSRSSSYKHNHTSLSTLMEYQDGEEVALGDTIADDRASDLDRIYDKEELEWVLSRIEHDDVKQYFLTGVVANQHTHKRVRKFRQDIKRDYEKRYMAVY